jgi:hypothetical protein
MTDTAQRTASMTRTSDAGNIQQATLDEFDRNDGRCSAVAVDTEEQCKKRTVPGSEYCHLHLDLREFSQTSGY